MLLKIRLVFTQILLLYGFSGINKRKLDKLGCNYACLVADDRTVARAKEKEITRFMAAVEIAAEDRGRKIFVLGKCSNSSV